VIAGVKGAALAAAAATTLAVGTGIEALPDAPLTDDYLAAASESTPLAERQDMSGPAYDSKFNFTRVMWSGGRGGGGFGRGRGRGGGSLWAHDYPRADRNFLAILTETTLIRTDREHSKVVTLEDPELFRNPVIYLVEPGYWQPSAEALENLGNYLKKGGFLIVDDFRGPRELANLEFYLGQALPELGMIQVHDDNEIFDSFFRVSPSAVVPPYGGYAGVWYGIYEDNDPTKRLMVIINANNDMAEYWEYSDQGYYAIDLSNDAYKLGVNYVVYALTH
jgi:hypothetical protein